MSARQCERRADILSANPGRLVDLIEPGRISLKNISYLDLDESWSDMGFEPQIRRIVRGEDMPRRPRPPDLTQRYFPTRNSDTRA